MIKLTPSTLSIVVAVLAAIVSAATVFHPIQEHLPSQTPLRSLPIFFFHGVTLNAQSGLILQQHLSTPERPFISLNFCENACSWSDLTVQTKLAIAQIRNTTSNDRRFDRGYVFIGHSQGGLLARAVIEEMDDHMAHAFISLAGAANGIFYGPQSSDFLPAMILRDFFSPVMFNKSVIDFASYSDDNIRSGKLQIDLLKHQMAHPELQSSGTGYQLTMSPLRQLFPTYSTFMAVINNLQAPENAAIVANQQRRKRNFLKLQVAHFYSSPQDETVAPWQSSVLGQYNDADSIEELEERFVDLHVLPMEETEAYKLDTYGLRSLDERGGLFLHVIENVSHACWLMDSVPVGGTEKCEFQRIFEKTLYPLLNA